MKNVLHYYSDEALNQKLKMRFEEQGYDFISENSLQRVLKSFRLNNIYIVIFSLPIIEENTEPLFKFLKNDKHYRIPIIGIVPANHMNTALDAMKIGFSDYLSNDTSPAEIVNYVNNYFAEKRSQAEYFEEIKKMSIAVIDDNPLQADLMKILFNINGIKNLRLFSSGEQYLNDRSVFDIYLIDIVLGPLSGIQLISEVRKNSPDSVIFAISAVNHKQTISSALYMGADDFILKPIEIEIFYSKLFANVKAYSKLKQIKKEIKE